jgi:hypothetical protein
MSGLSLRPCRMTSGEVLPGVVDDLVGDRADQAGFRRAGHAGDRGPEGLGELHGVAADAARGADDQDLLPSPDSPGAQALQGGEPGDRDDRGLLEAQPGGLADQVCPLAQRRIRRMSRG